MIISKKLIAAVRVGLVLFVAGVAGPSVRAVVTQVVHGAVPAAVAQLQPTGSLPGTTNLSLAIGLPLRNQAALSNLLHQIHDPASPNYRHYLTPAQFTKMFGPTAQDYQALINFAKANGLAVTGTHPNRLLLDVQGPVVNIEKAFHLALNVYQHPTEGRTFYAPDVAPSFNLAVPVLTINGLNNFSQPHPMNLIRTSPRRQANGSVPIRNPGSGVDGTYLGYDFRNAYLPGVNMLTGAGQAVGLVEFDGYYPNDIALYTQQAGLPSVSLQDVFLDGYDGTPGPNNIEVALDIEMAIAMAPGLSSVIVYQAGPLGNPNDVLSRIASDNLAKQISCSWSWGGGPDLTADNLLMQMQLQGQSFFNASGDSDAISGSTAGIFPCDNPNLTSVGATTLTCSPDGSWSAEGVWNWGVFYGSYVGSSGGISTTYRIPWWQQGVDMSGSGGSTTMRNFPDVAMVGDNIEVFYGNGQQASVGGTSCAAPLWAAYVALANQQAVANGLPPVGFINPALYSLGNTTADFHDITNGNNTNAASSNQFFAVVGYDLCTGWGSPNGNSLLNDLTGTVSQPLDITRSALYWFTHGYTNTFAFTGATLEQAIVANGGNLNLGFIWLPVQSENSDNVLDSIDTFMEALGFYYKGSGTSGDGSPASSLCQARKKLAPELIAAIANNVLLGTDPANASYNTGSVITNFPSDLISQATQAAAGFDVAKIKTMTGILHKFNDSGITNNFPAWLVECSPNNPAFLRQITRDPTTYYNCPGLNDSCATAENVLFANSGPFAPAKFQRTGMDTRKYAGNSVFYEILPSMGFAGRRFTVKTAGSNFSPTLTVLEGQCALVASNGTLIVSSNNLTVVSSAVNSNAFTSTAVSFTTDGVSTNFIQAGGSPGKLNITITSP